MDIDFNNLIKQKDLDNFHFFQVPRKIWTMKIDGVINDLAFVIYVEFFDRLKLSAINKWIDKNGNVYIKYSYEELMEILKLKSKGSISKGIKCLIEKNLVIQKKGFNTSSIFYLTNILNLSEVHKREHSSTRKETQKYTDVDANNNYYNHIDSNNNNSLKNIIVDSSTVYYKSVTEALNDILERCSFEYAEIETISEQQIKRFLHILHDKERVMHYILNDRQIETVKNGFDFLCKNFEITDIVRVVNYYFREEGYKTLYGMLEPKKLNYILFKLEIIGTESAFESDGKIKDSFDI